MDTHRQEVSVATRNFQDVGKSGRLPNSADALDYWFGTTLVVCCVNAVLTVAFGIHAVNHAID